MHEGINDAVRHLVDLGRVQAVGVLVKGPAAELGGSALRRMPAQRVDIGLHLDLTEFGGAGCGPLPLPLSELIAKAYLGRLQPLDLRPQIRAQLDAFELLLGHAPAFVDGHRHVHQLPAVREALLAELHGRYAARLPWIRCTVPPPLTLSSMAGGWSFKAATIACLGGRPLQRAAKAQGFVQNRRLLGVYDFRGGAPRYRRLLQGWLGTAGRADLLMCHPGSAVGRDGVAASVGDSLSAARQAELEVLSDPAWDQWLAQARTVMAPMSQILGLAAIAPAIAPAASSASLSPS